MTSSSDQRRITSSLRRFLFKLMMDSVSRIEKKKNSVSGDSFVRLSLVDVVAIEVEEREENSECFHPRALQVVGSGTI